MSKRSIILCCLFALYATTGHAQSKEDEARVLYQKADELYAKIIDLQNASTAQYYYMAEKKKNYMQADDYLAKASDLVGVTPKILYLDIKILYDGLKQKAFPQTKGGYTGILKLINMLFAAIDKNNYPQEKINEMINIKIAVEERLKDPNIVNPRTFTSREEAFNFISEAIKKYRTDDRSVNITWDGKNGIEILLTDRSVSGSVSYYVYMLDVSALQADTYPPDHYNSTDAYVRVNHYFIFPAKNGNDDNFMMRYVFFSDSKIYRKGPKEVQTVHEFVEAGKRYKWDRLMGGLGANPSTCHKIDIFLEGNECDGAGGGTAGLNYKDQTFQNEVEIDYVNAWKFLYDTSKK